MQGYAQRIRWQKEGKNVVDGTLSEMADLTESGAIQKP
jgi:hypothetical protein